MAASDQLTSLIVWPSPAFAVTGGLVLSAAVGFDRVRMM
jgi:hypothetical protein